MYSEPPDFDRQRLARALSDGWGLTVASLRYEPVGFGTHHYVVRDEDGTVWFVNVDELAAKVCIAPGADQALDAIDRALRTAMALRRAGLEFVHAPAQRVDGAAAGPLGDDYAVSVFAFVEGTSSAFGEHASDHDRRLVLGALGRMHAATDHVPPDLPRRDTLEVPVRKELFEALSDDRPTWNGGPFSEPARLLLSEHRDAIRKQFEIYDEKAAAVARRTDGWVVTHGEPHAANLIRTHDDGFVLIDWDTAAIGPRERDLWMVEPKDGEDLSAYTSNGGIAEIDIEAIDLYRLWWTLTELSLYTSTFRSTHVDDPNTRLAWKGLNAEMSTIRDGTTS